MTKNHASTDCGISPLSSRSLSNIVLAPARRTGIVRHPFSIGAFDAQGSFIEDFRLRRHYGTSITDTPPVPENDLDEDVIYGGIVIPHWGHFLLESLARVWFLREYPERAIIWHNLNFRPNFMPWQTQLLDMFGLAERRHVFVQTPTRVRSIEVPEPGFVLGTRLHPSQIAALAEHPFRRPLKGRKIWLSRSELPEGAVGGEKQLEAQLSSMGWQIIHPEKLSVRDQIEALSDAEIIGGFEGSAFHTLILGRNIRARIRIVNRRKELAQNYTVIANAKWLDQKNFCAEMNATQLGPEKMRFDIVNPGEVLEFLNSES